MKVLFVCNQNKYRSPVAERLFSDRFETRSRGLFGGNLISLEDVKWSDAIVVMEYEQRVELLKRFPACFEKRLLCLDIPDQFVKENEIIEILKRKEEVLNFV
jgi:predicted protein tyrosine phosphatase